MQDDWTTRRLIEAIAADPSATPSFGELLDRFRERAHGLFLLVAVLPAFLPLPAGAGAISGPLVMFAGLQMLCLAEHPWLPAWLRRRRIEARHLAGFQRRLARPLGWLERFSRPRGAGVFEHPAARAFTGLLLLVLGFLLALPIPLTNYPFGLVLVVYAVALIERDGHALALAWALGLLQIGLLALFSDGLLRSLPGLMERLGALFG